ncbi:MAG: DUF1912 family protein [Lactovum sp.]
MTENYEKKFLSDFNDWVNQQVLLMEKAMKLSDEEGEKEAEIRYESRLDAYRFLQTKFENYREGLDFHEFTEKK